MSRIFFVFFAAASATAPAAAQFTDPADAGLLESPPRLEASGLAVSRRSPEVLWIHDDSGGAASLYAVTTTGKRVGTLQLQGVHNEDWEDIASYRHDGKAWLLVADTGDNDAIRPMVLLHLVEEPALEKLTPDTELRVRPTRTLRVRYPEGPRDCESVAVDPVEGAIYLLTKRDDPPRLYRVSLADPGSAISEAKFVCTVPAIIGKTSVDDFIKRIVGKKFSWPTAMDFSADGRTAVVLTYGEPLVFARTAGETWASAFQRAPIRLTFHGLPQAEAACFSDDGRTIFVASEGTKKFVRYDFEER